MKKTLITLAALAMASVASAATTLDVTSPTGTMTGTFSDVDSAYTMVLTLDWDSLVASANTWNNRKDIYSTTATNTGYFNSDSWKNGIMMYAADENTLYANPSRDGGQKTSFTSKSEGATMSTKGDAYVLDKATYGIDVDGDIKVAVAISYSTDQVATIYALKNDGTLGYAAAAANSDWNPTGAFNKVNFIDATGVINSAQMFDVVLTTNEITGVAQKALGIPEPTTATLSLLALAGLAARRRRK